MRHECRARIRVRKGSRTSRQGRLLLSTLLDTFVFVIVIAMLWFMASRTRRLRKRIQPEESQSNVRSERIVVKVGLDEELKLSTETEAGRSTEDLPTAAAAAVS